MSTPDYPKLAREAIERGKKYKAERLAALDEFSSDEDREEVDLLDPEKAIVPVILGPWREYLRSCKGSAGCEETLAALIQGAKGHPESMEVYVQANSILACQPKSKPEPKQPAKP